MAVLLLVYLIVEVAAVWAVISLVGIGWTLLLLLAGAVIGSWLARREGGKAARAVMTAAKQGKPGHQEITDGMLVALGGLLIFLPGFVTDVVGVLVMVQPVRGLLRRAWLRKLDRLAPRSRRVVIVEGDVVDGDVAQGDVVGDDVDNSQPRQTNERRNPQYRGDPDGPRIIEG